MATNIYTIGGYKLKLAPMTMERRERIDEILRTAGLKSVLDLLERAFQEVIELLKEQRVLALMYAEALEFQDDTILHRWLREWRMRRKKLTKLSIIKQMEVPQEVEVFTDFFTVKLGARVLFGNSLQRMASSLKEMQAEMNTLGGTSSTS